MALTDFFTQIANSIRSKDGTTEPIVATDFPQRILDIPSGSGGLFDCYNGEFVLNYDHNLFVDNAENKLIISHNIGKVPLAMILYCEPSGAIHTISTIVYALYFPATHLSTRDDTVFNMANIVRINGSTNSHIMSSISINGKGNFVEVNDTQIIVGKGITTSNFIFRSGNIYKWIAIVEKGSAS